MNFEELAKIENESERVKRVPHVYESLGFRKLRINVNAWNDQLGQPQTSVDYELMPTDFNSYAT